MNVIENVLTDDLINEALDYGYATCPICKSEKEIDGRIYTKRKLQISNDNTFGYCHRCTNKFYKLEYDDKGNLLSTKKIFSKRIDYDNIKKFNSIDCSIIKDKLGFLEENGLQYIQKRNKYLHKDFLKELNISSYKNSVYIPFYFNKFLFYYQIRFFNSNSKMKYFNPPIDNKPFYLCGNFIFTKPFIFVEGCFDAFAMKFMIKDEANVISLLGHTISNYQYWLLRQLCFNPTSIIVMMDDTEKSVNLCKKLKKFRYKNKIYYINVPQDCDPEELLITKGIEGFKSYFECNLKKFN